METQIIKFGLSTPTLVIIQDEMPKSRVINLLIDHVVDDEDARAAIELVCGSPRAVMMAMDGPSGLQ
ncbi:hypothetical protein [Rhizobium sp. BG4]|uniref:hypothetical protein n=1 Tax=Rhizobium sp. BG4 TaxID=2613770 RepID=UPI00193C9A88|nr:hypothetical protein [Rhizobium sp. BG4]QRM47442.1 hypothetical protein F2982_29495 [Rhizobium sp. BG4]